MRALRYHGNQDLRIDEILEPECKPGFVKIKIAWCGICGSDIGEYANGPRIWVGAWFSSFFFISDCLCGIHEHDRC